MAGTAATAQQKPPAQQQQRGNTVLGRVAICIVVGQILLVVLASLVFSPPVSFLGTRLSLLAPFVHQVDLTQLHQVYHERYEEVFAAGGQKDLLFDWTQPVPHWLYHLVERFAQWIEIDLPASILPAPLHLMHVMQGPARMQVMRAVVLLGVPDLLADRVLSLSDLYDSVRANAAGQAQTMREGLLLKEGEPLPGLEHMPIGKLERLMHYALTFGYFSEVGYVGSHIYTNNAQSAVLRKDHPNNMNHLLFHFSNEAYLGWHRLFEAILAPEDAGSLPREAELFGGLAMDATFAGESASPKAQAALKEHQRIKAKHLEQLKTQLGKDGQVDQKGVVQHPTAWRRALNENMWDFFQNRPALQRNFQQAMSDIDGNVNRALLADYEWNTLQIASSGETKQVETIVDVGGAEGAFLSNILSSPPNSGIPHGILYDLASNIAAAKALWTPEAKTVRGELKRTRKIELVAGDFFRPETIPLPKTLDTPVKYVLRQILHDWSDSESLRILRNFRLRLQGYRAVAVVLVEVNRPASEGFLLGHRRSPGDYSSSGHLARPSGMRSFIDGQMMVCCNGKERAPEQWREIFQLTGWRLVKQVQTRSVFSVMELQMDEAAEGKGPSSSQEGKSTQKEEL